MTTTKNMMRSTLVMLIALVGCGESPAPMPVDAARNASDAVEPITSDFMIALDPTTLALSVPSSAVVAVKVERVGPASSITFTIPNLPSYVTATVTPSVAPPGTDSAQLTITVSAPFTGAVELDATGFTQHGEAVGDVTRSASVSVTAN